MNETMKNKIAAWKKQEAELGKRIKTETDKGKKKALNQELKVMRSRRLAYYRVNKAIKTLQQVESLATPLYTYTDEQKQAIVSALSDAVVAVDNSFNTKQVLKESFCI